MFPIKEGNIIGIHPLWYDLHQRQKLYTFELTRFSKSQVLVRHHKRHLHLLTAKISASFLRKLDFPARPPEPVSLHTPIQHVKIPYEPLDTFRKRLLKHIFPTHDKPENGEESPNQEQACTHVTLPCP